MVPRFALVFTLLLASCHAHPFGLSSVLKAATSTVSTAVNTANALTTATLTTATNAVSTVANATLEAASTAVSTVANTTAGIVSVATAVTDTAVNATKAVASTALNVTSTVTETAVNATKTVVSTALNVTDTVTGGAVTAVTDAVTSTIEKTNKNYYTVKYALNIYLRCYRSCLMYLLDNDKRTACATERETYCKKVDNYDLSDLLGVLVAKSAVSTVTNTITSSIG